MPAHLNILHDTIQFPYIFHATIRLIGSTKASPLFAFFNDVLVRQGKDGDACDEEDLMSTPTCESGGAAERLGLNRADQTSVDSCRNVPTYGRIGKRSFSLQEYAGGPYKL